MECKKCGKEMKSTICKYVTVNTCPDSRHRQILEWDPKFLI